jgi:hyperosmotically inducible periplasmic protein
MKSVYFLPAVALMSAMSLTVMAQSSTDTMTPADNSKTNKSDSHMAASADAQKNDQTDLSLTQQIRRSLLADKSLSTYAHNVKIVAVNGTVTLNGVVRSSEEKMSVQAKAESIAGQDHVVDQLTIAVPKS